MPILVVCGTRSPEAMRKICAAISAGAARGSLVTLDDASHAMTTTHADAVAALIADLADTAARSPAPRDV
jgi:pimeloyl-ACP methyl ester carboxylesterase